MFQQRLLGNLSNGIGREVNMEDARAIADMIFCQSAHNLSRSSWLTQDTFDMLMNLKNDSYSNLLVHPQSVKYSGGK